SLRTLPYSPLFPYTTLFRSLLPSNQHDSEASLISHHPPVSFGSLCQRNGFDYRSDLLQGQESVSPLPSESRSMFRDRTHAKNERSEEHTSELQSLAYLVCRL